LSTPPVPPTASKEIGIHQNTIALVLAQIEAEGEIHGTPAGQLATIMAKAKASMQGK